MTALVLPLPTLSSLLAEYRRQHDPDERAGLPPHIVLASPFVPDEAWAEEDDAVLVDVCASIPSVQADLERIGRLPDRLHLAARPRGWFEAFEDVIDETWPGPPRPRVAPHVTVAVDAPHEVERRIEVDLREHLPLRVRLTEVWRMRYDGTAWQRVGLYALG